MPEHDHARPQGFTDWKNDTDKPVRFRIFQHPPVYQGKILRKTGWLEVEIMPGEQLTLSSDYDNAIQTMEHGRIVAGLAPQLTKNGTREAMHPSLDVESAARAETEKAAMEAMAAKKRADDAFLVAQAKEREAREANAPKSAEPEPEPEPKKKKAGGS